MSRDAAAAPRLELRLTPDKLAGARLEGERTEGHRHAASGPIDRPDETDPVSTREPDEVPGSGKAAGGVAHSRQLRPIREPTTSAQPVKATITQMPPTSSARSLGPIDTTLLSRTPRALVERGQVNVNWEPRGELRRGEVPTLADLDAIQLALPGPSHDRLLVDAHDLRDVLAGERPSQVNQHQFPP